MNISVGLTALDPDHLPEKDGEQMYSDDVAAEVSDVVSAALSAWYAQRGRWLLAGEPTVG